MLNIWLHASSYEHGNESGWILRIVANKSLNLAKKHWKENKRMKDGLEMEKQAGLESAVPSEHSEHRELLALAASVLTCGGIWWKQQRASAPAAAAQVVPAQPGAQAAPAPIPEPPRTSWSWDFNGPDPTAGIRVIQGSWKHRPAGGSGGSACMEITSDPFMAELEIGVDCTPLHMSMQAQCLPPQPPSAFYIGIGWSEYHWHAAFRNIGSMRQQDKDHEQAAKEACQRLFLGLLFHGASLRSAAECLKLAFGDLAPAKTMLAQRLIALCGAAEQLFETHFAGRGKSGACDEIYLSGHPVLEVVEPRSLAITGICPDRAPSAEAWEQERRIDVFVAALPVAPGRQGARAPNATPTAVSFT